MEKEEYENIIRKCANNLDYFGRIISPQTYYLKSPEFHKEIDSLLLDESIVQLLIEAPRGTAKSSKSIQKIMHHCIYDKGDKFVIIQSKARPEAINRLTKIKDIIEYNNEFRELFGYCGSTIAEVWREDKITTYIGGFRVTIKALGTGQQVRGALESDTRITLYCHAKGSLVWNNDRLIPIEETDWIHLPERIDKVKEITIYGNPIKENVTYEHRVWVKEKLRWYDKQRRLHYKLSEPHWIETKDLEKTNFWIGEPINYKDSNLQPIKVFTNRLPGGLGFYKEKIPEYFYDKEFWWAYGLWWGDGFVNKNMVSWSCADKYPEIKNRLIKFISKYGSAQRAQRQGCEIISWCKTEVVNWLKTQKEGDAIKIPAKWVRELSKEYLREIVRGLVDSDGHVDYSKERPKVRITSVNLEGLLILQKMLAKLDIPSWVRATTKPRWTDFKNDYISYSRQKYDIYFRNNVEQLGINIRPSTRYKLNSVFIEDGYLWKQLKDVKDNGSMIICPVTTPDHTYLSPMGKNHNCLDDPDSEENTLTKEQMEKNFDKFLGGIAGLDRRNGRVIVIGTPIRQGCIVERLRNANGWTSVRYQAYDPETKIPLWKEMYSYDWLMGKMSELKDLGKLSKFYSEYMCEIVGEEDQLFKPQYWEDRRYTGHLEINKFYDVFLVISSVNGVAVKKRLPVNTFLGVDPASSTKQSADYFVVFPIAVDNERNIYCLPFFRGRVTPFDGGEQIINKIKSIRPKRGGIETTGYQEMLRQFVKQRLMEENLSCPGFENTEGFKPKTEKSVRLEQLHPLFIQKKVWIPEEGMQVFIDELLMYPRGKHDDTLDGFYYATRKIFPPDHQELVMVEQPYRRLKQEIHTDSWMYN